MSWAQSVTQDACQHHRHIVRSWVVELDGDHCAGVLEGCEQRDLGPEFELLGDA